MNKLGTTVNPRQDLALDAVSDLGLAWVRFTLRPEAAEFNHLQNWLIELHRRGIRSLGVLDADSLPQMSPGLMRRTIRDYADHYAPYLDAIQCGNESDQGPESGSSWPLSPATIDLIAREVRAFFPPTTLVIGPGLVSGHPSYAEGLDRSLFDGLAVHPYGRTPFADYPHVSPGWGFGTLGELLDLYRPFGLPLWVTEFGAPKPELPSLRDWSTYYRDMAAALLQDPDVVTAMLFCLDDYMVPGFGVYDHGARTPAVALLTALTQPQEDRVPQYIESHDFARYAKEHGLSDPLTDEAPVTTGQLTPEGLLLYLGAPANRTVRVLVADLTDALPDPKPPPDPDPEPPPGEPSALHRFAVWNGTTIRRGSMTAIAQGVRALNPRADRWRPEWLVKAGEAGTWQRQWDPHPLAISGPDALKDRIREGEAEGITVTPYLVVRGRPEWRSAEHAQIIACAERAERVVLNLESGGPYWNGPTDQARLQAEYLWPLQEKLREIGPSQIEVCCIPRQHVIDSLGGVGCLAAWLSFAQSASWQCYDSVAPQDLNPETALWRVDAWAAATGWGQGPDYRIPVVQQDRIAAWAHHAVSAPGMQVWHLDGAW